MRGLLRSSRGAVLIEMALALPVLVLLMFAIVSYGGWLALAHAVQQSANEAARATLAGVSAPERAGIARQAAMVMLARSYAIREDQVAVAVQDDGDTVAVTVAYDASGNAMLALPLIPRPPSRIARTSAIRLSRL